MNRKEKRQRLTEVNRKMKENGLPEISQKELSEMERFHLAYQMEINRMKKKRELILWILGIVIFSIMMAIGFGYMDWLIESLTER